MKRLRELLFIICGSVVLQPCATMGAQARSLPGESAPPVGSDARHLSTEEALNKTIDQARFGNEPDTNRAALTVSYPPAGRAQEVSELRCRGGKDAFVIDKLDEETDTLSLNFNASPRAAGADSQGLDPGTCSWIDRTVKEDEWRQIHFVVTRAQAQSIPTHLKDRNNYWSFFVVNTDRGYFDVKKHHVWTAETKQGSPGMPSRAQEVSELRCRGGKDAFVIDKLDEDTDSLSLNFNSSPRAAGADSKGLDPGTCSWIDRPVKEDEWRQIHFVVTRAQAQSIPTHLTDRNNYWSFFVVNTDRGYFEVKKHQVWPAETKQASPGMPSPTESQPRTPPASFAGKWNLLAGLGGTPFTLSLQETGPKVTGSFSPQNGTIEGTAEGKTLRFQWTQAGGCKGSGYLEMNADGKSLSGVFTTVEGPAKSDNRVSATSAGDVP